jgi:hypothetical protein
MCSSESCDPLVEQRRGPRWLLLNLLSLPVAANDDPTVRAAAVSIEAPRPSATLSQFRQKTTVERTNTLFEEVGCGSGKALKRRFSRSAVSSSQPLPRKRWDSYMARHRGTRPELDRIDQFRMGKGKRGVRDHGDADERASRRNRTVRQRIVGRGNRLLGGRTISQPRTRDASARARVRLGPQPRLRPLAADDASGKRGFCANCG